MTCNILSRAVAIAAVVALLGFCAPVVADVDLLFDPASQTISLDIGDLIEINLVAHSSDGTEQPIVAIDAILNWDPGFLELLGADASGAGPSWSVAGFLNDPDDINQGIDQPPLDVPANDGNAIYTVLVEPGMTVSVGPNDLVVTTIQFRALQTTQATVVSYLPAVGIYGETRVFGAGIQNNITGDISATAFVEVVQFCSVVCPTDINGNFETTAFDLAVLLGCWGGVMPGTCVCLDADHNGDIGAFDLAVLLGAWGPCSGVPGACCNADGMGGCQILLEGDCDAVGGVFLGPATQCEDCLHEACSPDAGDCSTANGTAGCDDVACCDLVCDLDPFCCDVEWDELCAGPNTRVLGASCTELCTEPGQPCDAFPPGTIDIAVSRIGQPADNSYEAYGVVGDIAAFSAATTACNIGNTVAEWLWTGNEEGTSSRHPLIAQNLYRLSADGRRFEMIGMSWLKHAFCALNEGTCGSCQVTGCATLGIGCADTYTATRNGSTNLGPRRDVNPLGFSSQPDDPGTHSHPLADPSGAPTIAARLQVHTADLGIPGAEYFVEAHYVTHDEPVERRHNNASWLKVSMPPGPEFTGDILNIDTIRMEEVALKAWQESDPGVVIESVDDEQGGRFHLSYRVTDNGDGTWHYEYALHNMNSHLAANNFVIPAPDSVLLTNIEFHDVDYHSGDGDLDSGGNFDGTDWTATRGSAGIVWAMEVVGDYNNSNALRWGTTYNFRFDANTPPQAAEAEITHYRSTEGPASITVQTLAPAP